MGWRIPADPVWKGDRVLWLTVTRAEDQHSRRTFTDFNADAVRSLLRDPEVYSITFEKKPPFA